MLAALLKPTWASVLILLATNLALWLWVWRVPPIVLTVRRLPLGGLGLALPGLVLLLDDHATEPVLRHELVHQQQMRRYSPLGTSLLLGWHYGVGFLRLRRMGRRAFWSLWATNPLEQEALREMNRTEPLPKLIDWRGKRLGLMAKVRQVLRKF